MMWAVSIGGEDHLMCWARRDRGSDNQNSSSNLSWIGEIWLDRWQQSRQNMKTLPWTVKQSFKTLTAWVGLAFFSELHPPGSFLLTSWQRRSCPGLNVCSLTKTAEIRIDYPSVRSKERSRIIPCNFLKITWAIDSVRNLFYELQNIKINKNSLISYKTWLLTRSSGRLSISNFAPLNLSGCIESRDLSNRILPPGVQWKLHHYY